MSVRTIVLQVPEFSYERLVATAAANGMSLTGWIVKTIEDATIRSAVK